MLRPMTLPELESKLDRLSPGDRWEINQADYLRVFGANDVARARLENFARGHRCGIAVTQSGIEFRKLHADQVVPIR
ncbi:hypothetical protein [Microvirga massiliensis]|uniref:hypothetical protein n=1 Tax=Microvirga massiliensis TaxID=1033741 RepID=UPI00062B6911|nr:hypothetical protein [Microvirga massiliensis]